MLWKRLRLTLEMIKFEHSVFALPFALTGALLAFREGGFAAARDLAGSWLWIVVAMVGARSAAMAFNRLVDADIDARNPRTQHAPPARRPAVARVRLGLRGGRPRPSSLLAAGELNRAVPAPGAAGAGDRILLFLHQAVHLVFPPGAGLQPGNRAGGGVDRRARLARPAHPLAHRRGDVLDRRFRRDLLLPGLRIRLRRGPLQRAARRWASPARCAWPAALHVLMVVCLLALV